MTRKTSNTYYFSVEGNTEKLYLEWLAETIKKSPSATCLAVIKCKVEQDPVRYVKKISLIKKTNITHLCDIESQSDDHIQKFTNTLKRMKEAQKIGKQINYKLGYSNFTFELWMILHKADCFSCYNYRDHYLTPLNRAYMQDFESLNDYKQENNFKTLLSQLSLKNVIEAIARAKIITERNKANENTSHTFYGFEYYKDNPSLSIWVSVETILKDCGLM